MRGLEAFIVENWPFGFRRTSYGRRPPLVDISSLSFFGSTSDTYLKVFPDSNWADFGVSRKLWMSSFHNTKEIKNPMVG